MHSMFAWIVTLMTANLPREGNNPWNAAWPPILMADVVGYCRLMEADEAGTLAALKERRKAILEPIVTRAWRAHRQGHGRRRAGRVRQRGERGRRARSNCSARWRRRMRRCPTSRRIVLRIGINLGDVIGEGGDIYGDGVNIAARLEALAEPGGICISAKVHEEVRGKLDCAFEDMGEQTLKNIARPVRVYRLRAGRQRRRRRTRAGAERCPTSRRSRCCRSRT